MKVTAFDHGLPCWVDLGSPDSAGAAAFYGELFGWSSEEGSAESGGYRRCTLNGEAVAGIGSQEMPDIPPFWATYISVDDAAAVAAKVAGLGGKVIVEPMDVMGLGTMAIFSDPTGAVISVWQAGTLPGAGVIYETGAMGWNELMSTDVDASIAFYSALFGWGHETHGRAESGAYTEFKVDGRSIAGLLAKPDTVPAEIPSNWSVYFVVDDTDAAAAKVTELGGLVIVPPMDIEPGRFSVVADPHGATFNIIKMHGMEG